MDYSNQREKSETRKILPPGVQNDGVENAMFFNIKTIPISRREM
jgi:hypothetical protein